MSYIFTSAPSTISHWIGNQATVGSGSRRADVFNPALGSVARQVVLADQADVEQAVASARAALPAWAASAPQKRARVMFKIKELVERHADDLARLITGEHGKTFPDAQGEVQRGLEVIEFACGIPQLLKGQYSNGIGGGINHWSQRMP